MINLTISLTTQHASSQRHLSDTSQTITLLPIMDYYSENEVEKMVFGPESISLVHGTMPTFPMTLLHFHYIQSIQISHCGLVSLPPLVSTPTKPVFPRLKKLDLSSNKLEWVENIRLHNLLELDCSNNKIQTIQDIRLPNLTSLRLNHNKLTGLPIGFFIRSVPNLKSLYFKGNLLCDLFHLVHSKIDIPLVSLDCSSNLLSCLPSNMDEYFPHLSRLDVSHNTRFAPTWMPKFSASKLAYLNFSSCRVTKFAFYEEEFTNGARPKYPTLLPQLQVLDLSKNNLSIIPDLPLPNLRSLFLSSNKIQQMSINFGHNMPKLTVLDIFNNLLTETPPLALKNLSLLTLSYNPIKVLDNSIQFINIQSLVLQYQKLVKLPSFESLTQLQFLDCSHNLISEISPNFASEKFPQNRLLVLNLSANRLSILPFHWHCPVLHTLNISSNSLSFIDSSFLDNLPKLKSLFLNRNSLAHLPSLNYSQLAFISLVSNKISLVEPLIFFPFLKILDLSKQKLTYFANYRFDCLEYLNLSRNSISTFQQPQLELGNGSPKSSQLPFGSAYPRLLYLNLSKNKICGTLFLNAKANPMEIEHEKESHYFDFLNLKFLNVSQNSLQKIYTLSSKGKLENLNISQNKLTELKSLSLPELTNLNVSKNQLEMIENQFGLSMPKLRFLNLTKNCLVHLPQLSAPALCNLNLFTNKIVTYSPSFGSDFQNLALLDLSHQNISYITPFESPSIERLSLSFNLICDFPTFLFSSKFPKLSHITLISNNISKVVSEPEQKQEQEINTTVETLSLSLNSFSEFPIIFLQVLQNLQNLSLSSSSLTYLPDISHYNLKSLSVSKNMITKIDQNFGRGLPNLTSLDISSNLISSLFDFHLPNLTHFSCVNNKISKFNGFGRHLNKLSVLDLSQQQITSLSQLEPFFVEKLNLSHNFITRIHHSFSAAIQGLIELNLSSNHIETLDNIASLSLQRILLYNNPLTIISPTLEHDNPSLLKMYIGPDGKLFGAKLAQFKQKFRRFNSGSEIGNSNLLESVQMIYYQSYQW